MKTKFVLLIILFTLWLAQLVFTSTKVLIIGVGNFDDNRVIQLDGAVKDAKDFRDTIIALGLAKADDILFLENPTLAILNANIKRWFTNAEPQDKLIFYYSGHGYSKDGKTYLIPKDVDPSFIEDTGYNLTENLSKLLAQTRANEVIVIMDACYSGGIVKDRPLGGVRVETMSLEEVAKQKGAVFLLSSKPDEISQEKPTGGGWFTHYLLEGLKGEAGKGKEWITVRDIFEYVSKNVSRQTFGKQNPMLIGNSEIKLAKNSYEMQKTLLLKIASLGNAGQIPQNYVQLYIKVLTQEPVKDNELEKAVRSYLIEFAEEQNIKTLIAQTENYMLKLGSRALVTAQEIQNQEKQPESGTAKDNNLWKSSFGIGVGTFILSNSIQDGSGSGFIFYYGERHFVLFNGWRILYMQGESSNYIGIQNELREINISYIFYVDVLVSLGAGAGISFNAGPYWSIMFGFGLPIFNFSIGAHIWLCFPLLSNMSSLVMDISFISTF